LIYIIIKPCLFIAHKNAKRQGEKRIRKRKKIKRIDGMEQMKGKSKKSAPKRGFSLERSVLGSTALLKEEKKRDKGRNSGGSLFC